MKTFEAPDGATEADTERDGAFSYASEWHAFAVGFGVGLSAIAPTKKVRRFVWQVIGYDPDSGEFSRRNMLREAKKEGWYAFGGVFFGIAVGLFVAWQAGSALLLNDPAIVGSFLKAVTGA